MLIRPLEDAVRIKIFMDRRAVTVEEQVNHWFTNEAGNARIVKTEALLAPAIKPDLRL